MKKRKNVWLTVLWCAVGTAASAGAAWLISYIPWADTAAFRRGTAWASLICAVLSLIHTSLKEFLREKPWIKLMSKIVGTAAWLAWVCYGATLV